MEVSEATGFLKIASIEGSDLEIVLLKARTELASSESTSENAVKTVMFSKHGLEDLVLQIFCIADGSYLVMQKAGSAELREAKQDEPLKDNTLNSKESFRVGNKILCTLGGREEITQSLLAQGKVVNALPSKEQQPATPRLLSTQANEPEKSSQEVDNHSKRESDQPSQASVSFQSPQLPATQVQFEDPGTASTGVVSTPMFTPIQRQFGDTSGRGVPPTARQVKPTPPPFHIVSTPREDRVGGKHKHPPQTERLVLDTEKKSAAASSRQGRDSLLPGTLPSTLGDDPGDQWDEESQDFMGVPMDDDDNSSADDDDYNDKFNDHRSALVMETPANLTFKNRNKLEEDEEMLDAGAADDAVSTASESDFKSRQAHPAVLPTQEVFGHGLVTQDSEVGEERTVNEVPTQDVAQTNGARAVPTVASSFKGETSETRVESELNIGNTELKTQQLDDEGDDLDNNSEGVGSIGDNRVQNLEDAAQRDESSAEGEINPVTSNEAKLVDVSVLKTQCLEPDDDEEDDETGSEANNIDESEAESSTRPKGSIESKFGQGYSVTEEKDLASEKNPSLNSTGLGGQVDAKGSISPEKKSTTSDPSSEVEKSKRPSAELPSEFQPLAPTGDTIDATTLELSAFDQSDQEGKKGALKINSASKEDPLLTTAEINKSSEKIDTSAISKFEGKELERREPISHQVKLGGSEIETNNTDANAEIKAGATLKPSTENENENRDGHTSTASDKSKQEENNNWTNVSDKNSTEANVDKQDDQGLSEEKVLSSPTGNNVSNPANFISEEDSVETRSHESGEFGGDDIVATAETQVPDEDGDSEDEKSSEGGETPRKRARELFMTQLDSDAASTPQKSNSSPLLRAKSSRMEVKSSTKKANSSKDGTGAKDGDAEDDDNASDVPSDVDEGRDSEQDDWGPSTQDVASLDHEALQKVLDQSGISSIETEFACGGNASLPERRARVRLHFWVQTHISRLMGLGSIQELKSSIIEEYGVPAKLVNRRRTHKTLLETFSEYSKENYTQVRKHYEDVKVGREDSNISDHEDEHTKLFPSEGKNVKAKTRQSARSTSLERQETQKTRVSDPSELNSTPSMKSSRQSTSMGTSKARASRQNNKRKAGDTNSQASESAATPRKKATPKNIKSSRASSSSTSKQMSGSKVVEATPTPTRRGVKRSVSSMTSGSQQDLPSAKRTASGSTNTRSAAPSLTSEIRVQITGIDMSENSERKQAMKWIRAVGGKFAEKDPAVRLTHLIVGTGDPESQFPTSRKLLECLALCGRSSPRIVNYRWLQDSSQNKFPAKNTEEYAPRGFNKKLDMQIDLEQTLLKRDACTVPLLTGRIMYMTPSAVKDLKEMTAMFKNIGLEVIKKNPSNADFALVGIKEDPKQATTSGVLKGIKIPVHDMTYFSRGLVNYEFQ